MNGLNAAAADHAQDDSTVSDKTRGHRAASSDLGNGVHADAARGQPRSSPLRRLRVKTWARQCYQKLIVELILRERPLPPSKDGRHIPLDLSLRSQETPQLIDERRGHAFISNAIRTSRYNVFNFFPKQLFFQFSRLGNFYFLCVGVPQTIPGISTTGSFTTIIPLLVFVMLTILKEGYDDYKRHRLDKVENALPVTVLRRMDEPSGPGTHCGWFPTKLVKSFHQRHSGKVDAHELVDSEIIDGFRWSRAAWRELKVGDVIRLSRDEDVPADLVLLHADGENGSAYVETMALDGETNLKSKQVLQELPRCDNIQGLLACKAEFVVEDPNADLYNFDGRASINGKTIPLTLNEVVYRGSTLRNTPCAIGVVINTGEDCKIRMNANHHPKAKQPALEAVYNRIVLSLVFYVICLTMGCSIGYYLWQRDDAKYALYLEGESVEAEDIIIGYAIMFNNVIPLALYVSLEIIKIGQMLMLNGDLGMYDERTDTPARCNTNTILENLGQIGYIFSDKTGTLTENVMKFRKMTIAGTAWLHETDLRPTIAQGKEEDIQQEKFSPRAFSPVLNPRVSQDTISPTTAEGRVQRPTSGRRSSSHWRATARSGCTQPDVTTEDLVEFIRNRPNSVFARKAVQYILAMALCHTCLPEMRDGEIEYQSSSPDELALVKAAQELGYTVVQRTSQQITLKVLNADGSEAIRVYDILDVIEFSSKRKRMSIVLRCPDGRIWLISKGADSTILPRLRMAQVALQKAQEVRNSAEMERTMQRKSLQQEARNSFGARPSLTMRRSVGVNRPNAGGSTLRPPIYGRSNSFEVGSRYSSDDRSQPSVARGMSLDMTPSPTPHPSRSWAAVGRQTDKFAFLDDPSISDEETIFTRSFQLLDDFATEGLRTLLYAHKFISETEYQAWKKVFHSAETSLLDRQAQIEEAGDLIEQDLELVGASAIEDKLQKGVPETIDKLRRANIKIWMLTGDKRETAINIAHSAQICLPDSQIHILDATLGDIESQMLEVIDDLQLRQNHTVVVIDGHTLACIESPTGDKTDPRLKDLLLRMIPHIDSVICCRASPAQKAFIVRATRKTTSRLPVTSPSLTLAIGDGANDLAMIAEAHVGIGISGREGLQAARVADYAISQFRFLQRLLLVHGRWNYVRTAKFVLWTFWKEMFFYMPQILFTQYTAFTGTSLYESWSLTVLNVLFTSLAVIIPGVFEQDLKAETLLAVPELYSYGQRGKALGFVKYIAWMLGGGAEGVLVFYGCWAGYGYFGQLGGFRDDGLFAFGNLVFSACIIWINWKLLIIETHSKSLIIVLAFIFSFAGWWAWQGFLSGIYEPRPSAYSVRDGFGHTFGRDLGWWLTLLCVVAVLFVLEMAYKMIKQTLVIMGLRRWGRGWWARRWRGKQVDWMDDNLEDWDLGTWQEMEQDKTIRERLDGILDAEERGVRDAAEEEEQDKTSKERLDGILDADEREVGDAEEEESVQVLGSGERAVA